MQYLLQKQHQLKRSKFIYDSIIFIHTYILGPLGIGMGIDILDVNKVQYNICTFLGLTIVFYLLSLGMFAVVPFCIDRQLFIDRQLEEIKDNIKQVEQIHLSLDLLRNSMLFDEDETYWQKIEKLPVVFEE